MSSSLPDTPDMYSLVSTMNMLHKDLSRILPPDRPPEMWQKFLSADYQGLEEKLEHCLALFEQLQASQKLDIAVIRPHTAALAQDLNASLMKRLIRAIVETLPIPEVTINPALVSKDETGTVSRMTVRLYQLIRDNSVLLTGQPHNSKWDQDLNQRVSHQLDFYQRELNKTIATTDPPDIQALAYDLLRMEVLMFLLSDLRLIGPIKTLESCMSITARQAVNAASQSIERYLETPDEFNRFDLAVVIVGIDELVSVVQRVLEEQLVQEKTDIHGYCISETTLNRFVKNLGVLILKILDDLILAAENNSLEKDEQKPWLDKVERIYAFCKIVDPLMKIDLQEAAARAIQSRIQKLHDTLRTNA